MSLTDKQQAFIEEYLTDFNATQAALRAGYSEKTARSIGSENLTKPDIAEAIQNRLNELKMSADEALILLANQARASMADYFNTDAYGVVPIDLSTIPKEKLRAIKKLKISSIPGGVKYEIELYDAQAAQKEIIRLHRLDSGQATDNIEVTKNVKATDLSDDELAKIISSRAK